MDNEKKRRIVIIAAVMLGILGLTYLGGMIGQFMDHYKTWLEAGGVHPAGIYHKRIKRNTWYHSRSGGNFFVCQISR